MRVKIRRQDNPYSEPYWQEFEYTGPEDNSVAGLLDDLNYRDDIADIDGRPVRRISWECSCLQGVCGGCAMVIDSVPALACETFLRDRKGKTLVIEPLRKFPTVCDLVVDRGVIEESLREGGVYAGDADAAEGGPGRDAGGRRPEKDGCRHKRREPDPQAEHGHRYIAARCLKCGLCLEVCPNYHRGERFYGALFANDCYLCASLGADSADAYRDHFAAGCSKSLSCMKVCPMQIPTISSIAKMNRKR